MADPRVEKVAKILVDYSTRTKKGDVVMILADESAKPLVVEIYRQVLKKDPKEVLLQILPEEIYEVQYQEAPLSYLKRTPALEFQLVKKTDVYFALSAPQNTRFLSSVPPRRLSVRSRARRPILNWRVEKSRWVVCVFPTPAMAQEADMSLTEFEDFVYGSILNVDWKEKKREQDKLVRRFNKGKEIRIRGEDTDLTLRVDGRKFINGFGDANMPDGEIFTGPVEDSAEGHIRFSYPAIYRGREVDGVHLWFEEGRAVKATASKGEDFLKQILNTDRGARYIGELGIGNNFAIDRFVKDMLFDEKIGGSIHLALGMSYKETGGKNESAIHWDILKDLRQGGEIWLDGELLQKNGKWLIGPSARRRKK